MAASTLPTNWKSSLKDLADDPKFEQILERTISRASLADYFRLAWRIIEPETELLNSWHVSAMAEYLTACTNGQIRRLVINVPPRSGKSNLCTIVWPSWVWGPLAKPAERWVFASYAQSLSNQHSIKRRRILESEWYQRYWGHLVSFTRDQNKIEHYTNRRSGSMFSTSMTGSGTGFGGNTIVIDDPHTADQAGSRKERETQVDFFTQTLSRRLDNKKTGVIVLIMQRLAIDDLAGIVLDMGGWEHLKLPGVAGDEGERTWLPISKTWHERKPGELLQPAREGPVEIAEAQKMLGPRGFCTPYEAPVLMADLTLKSIGEVRAGDSIIGFAPNGQSHGAPTGKTYSHGKMTLKSAKVLSVSVSTQKLVRITLSSGKTIRCTADHKWYAKRSGNSDSHKPYIPARIGNWLYRVCDDQLPQIDTPEEARLAGWLSGFFDGEGTAVRKTPNEFGARRPGGLISFAQGCDRNRPLCDRLEHALTHFGFDWKSTPLKSENRKYMLMYYLRGMNPRQLVRFLHIVNPGKWRSRIAEFARTYRFIDSRERVVSIEPDNEETVYGLETETGNYIVWGIASSNSGQYQQEPVPLGGAVFLEEWWGEPYKNTPKHFEQVIQSWDTAQKTNEHNDHSVCTTWGTYEGKAYLLDVWRGKLAFPALKLRAASLYDRWKPTAVLIEDASSGSSLIQEFKVAVDVGAVDGRKVSIPVLPIKVDRDKLARAEAVTPMIARHDVLLPDPEHYNVPWLSDYMTEFARFTGMDDPEDDQVDSTTQALNYIRGLGSFNIMEHYRKLHESAANKGKIICTECQQVIPDGVEYLSSGSLKWHKGGCSE